MSDEPSKDDVPKGDGPGPASAQDAPVVPDAPAGASALEEAKKLLDAEPGSEADEEDEEEEDLASPEAIARRVAAFGEEDETERFAREEEAKLAARRKAQGKGKKKKKSGLEAAASKRLSKIGTKAPVKRPLPTAAEADPIVDRALKLGDWAKHNQGAVTAVVGAAILGLAALGVYTFIEKRHEGQASSELAKAVDDEKGRIGDPDKEDEEGRPHDPRPVFKTVEDRREAALREYRAVESQFKGTGAAILARLEEGSLLLDKRDATSAMTAFEEVRGSPLAKADAEVRGRALECLGFAYELKADGLNDDAQAKAAALDEASKVYRELENTDVMGFKELGMYHQARIFEKQGDKAKAIEMLKSLHERLNKTGETHPFVYLEHVADDRLRELDPSAVPAKPPGGLGGPGGSEAQYRHLMEQIQKGKAPGGGRPGRPPGMPGGGPGTPGGYPPDPRAVPMPVPTPEDLPP